MRTVDSLSEYGKQGPNVVHQCPWQHCPEGQKLKTTQLSTDTCIDKTRYARHGVVRSLKKEGGGGGVVEEVGEKEILKERGNIPL